MPPSQRRSGRRGSTAPSQDENQARIKIARRDDGINHRYADKEALDALQLRVAALPELEDTKKVTQTEMSECVVEAMRFLLAQNQVKPMVPVASAAISKILKELNVKASGITKSVMSRARVRFMGLGWDLVEIGTGYMLRSFVPHEFRLKYLLGKHDTSMHAVRLMVGMYLHTNGGKAGSDALRSFLERFGLQVSLKRQHDIEPAALERNKEQFGTENPINLLVEQKFLRKTLEKELDGGTEEVYSIGDAQTDEAAECTDDMMQDYLKQFMEI